MDVTCHLHFWQNDRVFYVPRRQDGMEGTSNKSQHRKLTLEKRNLLFLLPGFELATFRSRVRAFSVQLSPLSDWVVGGTRGTIQKEILFESFLREALVSSSDMGRDARSSMLSIQQFICRPRPALQGFLKDGFGEAVVECDVPEPCKFPSLDRYRAPVLGGEDK